MVDNYLHSFFVVRSLEGKGGEGKKRERKLEKGGNEIKHLNFVVIKQGEKYGFRIE